MLLDWFDSREATEIGATLADHFLPQGGGRATESRKLQLPKDGRDLQKFLQRVAREAGQLKLNLFRRAKLLNSFKWRLLEHGMDRNTADELTELLLLQLSGRSRATALRAGNLPAPSRRSSKRVPALLLEAESRFAERDYAATADKLREALAIEPRNAVAHANLGRSLCHLGRYQEGEQEFRRAIEMKATCPGAHLGLGTLLRAKGELGASETTLRRAVKQDPRDPQALVDLGLTLGLSGKRDEARECFERALRLKAQYAGALCGLGWLASVEGHFGNAETLYRSALRTEPLKAAAWAPIPELRRMTPEDKDWLKGVESTLASGVQPLEESKLRFALGKYFDDLGHISRAFEQFKRANELYKQVAVPYDRAARAQFVDDMIRVYTRQRLVHRIPGASESEKPVFVVGMMRSGTTLVEQIIASHPAAAAAGELDFWSITVHKKEPLRQELPDTAAAAKLAESYLKVLTRRSADAQRVVDKSTFNFECLGLIHSIFPRARFVYLQRDPVDTCLSCYFQNFANAASFTLDLSDLAHYYREHHRLMAHWRSALPEGTILQVPYEGLVAEQEKWSRKIVEFLGLEWHPRCLEFYKDQRPVLTASSWQVRQRMYSSSVGRSRKYEKYIGPLLQLRELPA